MILFKLTYTKCKKRFLDYKNTSHPKALGRRNKIKKKLDKVQPTGARLELSSLRPGKT